MGVLDFIKSRPLEFGGVLMPRAVGYLGRLMCIVGEEDTEKHFMRGLFI